MKSKKVKRANRRQKKNRKNGWFSWRNKGVIGALVIFVAVGLLGGVRLLKPSHAATVEPQIRVECSIDHFAPDDPIVFPNQPGASHMHSFYSNESTNANSTPATLSGSPGSCNYIGNYNRSAYWIPSVYYTNPDGTATRFSAGSQELIVYYRRPGGANGPKVHPFPVGLRMVAGNSHATSPQSSAITSWDCGDGGPSYSYIPDCTNASSGNTPVGFVSFPSCWDGVHLDSADHMSHMAYPNPTTGVCPAGHPVSLPRIDFEDWLTGTTGGPNYYLSSGGVYSMHGDVFEDWDTRLQSGLIDQCLNSVQRDCSPVIFVQSNNDVQVGGTMLFNLNQYSAVQAQGDINDDGTVNLSDLSILLSHWGTSYAAADLDNSGSVGLADLSILLSHWGT